MKVKPNHILFLSLIVLLYGKKKEKRDLSDLKGDSILSSVFGSDVKEHRTDRSTTLKDELLASQKDKSRHAQLTSILFPQKVEERRETDPLAELMSLNNHKNNTYNINSDAKLVNTVAPIDNVAKRQDIMASNMLTNQQAAVNPALFHSNYVPLPEETVASQQAEVGRSYVPMYQMYNQYPWQQNGYIIPQPPFLNDGRSIIPNTLIPYTMSTRLKDMSQHLLNKELVSKKDIIAQPDEKHRLFVDYKKSLIPLPLHPEISSKVPSTSSFPVQLRVNSQNENLRGIVPHVAEYGETVESIRQVQRSMNYKKNFIAQQPQPMYDTAFYKKNNIPKPSISSKKEDEMKRSKIKKNNKKGSKKSKKDQRQYIPQYPYQQYAPYISNYQQNPFAMQQTVMQPFVAPPSSAQVLNMDGLHTRPIITDESCADQYQSCEDFSKNNYCTNYAELMKIQCRKSCGYCAAAPISPATQVSNNTVGAEAKDDTPPSNTTLNAMNNQTVDDASSGSGDADAGESGSGESDTTPTAKRGNVSNSTLVDDSESGSGAIPDAESGNAESGSAESGDSDSESDALIAPVTHQKMPVLNGARSVIWKPKYMSKVDLGEFSLPTKKSVIPMAPFIKHNVPAADSGSDDDDDDDSGSGSGSGDESGAESGAESGDSEKKSVTPSKEKAIVSNKPKQVKKKTVLSKPKNTKKKTKVSLPTKRTKQPSQPSLPGAYPKIDLRAIASALAHYEQAALELAGEYPKPAQTDLTEYTRSFIPHPVDKAQENVNKYKQNLQVAKILTEERAKKSNVPKYLKLSKDVLKDGESEIKDPQDADSLDSVRQRFNIAGVEPTLNDYYAETGKLNPFDTQSKAYKKSKIEKNKKKQNLLTGDPYEYLRNMPAGASMEPIVDPRTRSTIPSDHSYPVVLLKVSPASKKYIDEPASRRGKIRKLNAEGVPIFDDEKKPALVPNPQPARQQPIPQTVVPAAVPAYWNQPQAQPAYQTQPQAEQIAYQNIEQMSAPKASAMFANEEQVEPQPGRNSLRSKMLSAFFNMKANDESSGSGDGEKRDSIGSPYGWPAGFKKK